MISMSISGLDETQGRLQNFIKYSQRDASKITMEYGTMLMETVKRNASGRPGPEVVTGAYRDSIALERYDQYSVAVGTSAAQAMRLEYGFVGIDALGRHYAQPPFPHWTPAKDEVVPKYVSAMQAAVRRWWK